MPNPTWTVELHAHTNYSKDCLLKPRSIPGLCQKKGIDHLAITDHNEVTAGLELARLHPMLIIPGIEVMTTQGELLGWYVQGPVPHQLSPAATIGHLREQGAIIGVSHPFDRYRSGAWLEEDLLAIVEQIDVIEVFNARCIQNADNLKALAFAQEHGKLMTCGSDAHSRVEYGKATMRMAPFRRKAESFREALVDAQRVEKLSLPSIHMTSTWAKWVKRLGLAARPEA
jgi:predicted metal-dependent phosphoesterase TrpH